MAERPFSYSSYDPNTGIPIEGKPSACQENTSALLRLYTRDLKSFVSRWASTEKRNLAKRRQSLAIAAQHRRPAEQRKMQDA
ncbi:hypothetical protein [Pseudomonas sp. S09G 359]|uniref:hypothetical protein n=1 Tax=Pseudomonas sp. S09G 359 TaxID=2054919 RepID=UPI0012FEFD9E|nr:hypothetical protein [Pseudomonas sp. S09G 359]